MENEIIIYGGAFNPPTIAHKQIGEYLLKRFPGKKIVYLPTNDFYNKSNLVSFENRFEMTKLLVKDLGENVLVSDYEGNKHLYTGTYYTLEAFNHPYFVIGADSLQKLSTWINGENLIKENKFIVFPREGYDLDSIMMQDILNEYKDNFVLLKDFKENNISSTVYRNYKDDSVLTKEVKEYIDKKGLYR